MSRLLTGLPLKAVEIREKETIEILKALRQKGFSEAPYNKERKERIFKKDGQQPVLVSVANASVLHGNNSWLGANYVNSINYIKNEL